MPIHVYKPGDTHEVDGLKCEIITCEIGDYEAHKSAGCVDDVRDLYPDLYKKMDAEELQENGYEPEEQIDLLDAPEFLTQNIPVDKADKSKKK